MEIRAPQAWQCENGLYTGTRVKIGLIDNAFDSQHKDFSSSSVRMIVPQQLTPGGFAGVPAVVIEHGTRVASILVARGDDSVGTAGMLWGADVSLYSMASGQDYAQSTVIEFARYLSDAKANAVKILNFSAGLGDASLQGQVRLIATAMQSYLASGGYLVVASGNSSLSMSIGAVASYQGPDLFATDVAAAQLYSTYPDQIYFVPAVSRTHSLLASSNYWTGATAIAAPGDSVWVRIPSSPYYYDGARGSSYAAPFVAGLIGQLLSMSGAITPADVKHYLTAGAQVPRRDSTTGMLVAPQPVSGVPGGASLYELDAYGSLSTLARERSDAPVCGSTIATTAPYPTNKFLLNKGPNPGDTVVVTVPGFDPFRGYVTPIQVRPGGREIELRTSGDSVPGQTIAVGTQGQRLYSIGAWWRQFFDRGYADFNFAPAQNGDSAFQLNVTIHGLNGAPSPPTFALRDASGAIATWPYYSGSWQPWHVAVSPHGEYVAFVHRHYSGFGAPTTSIAYYAQKVGASSAQLIQSFPTPCSVGQPGCKFDQLFGGIWSRDGKHVFFGHVLTLNGTPTNTYNEYSVSYHPTSPWGFSLESGVSETGGFVLYYPAVDPSNSVFTYRFLDSGNNCFERMRPVGAFTLLVSTPATCSYTAPSLLRSGTR